MTVAHGIVSSRAKSEASAEAAPARSAPFCCALMPAPPKIANHTRLTTVGTRRTPVTNSRMVRPREIRAMNIPTNGVHETHHAQ